jgi:transposase
MHQAMTASKYPVKLSDSEREYLQGITRRGKSPARMIKRALILRKADEGLPDSAIAESTDVGASTVARTRKRFALEGLEKALSEGPWPGQRPKLDGKQEAHLVAIACSDAPQGHSHWTLQLLANKVVEMEFADSISVETVRQILKKTNSSRGSTSNGASRR